jgi:steroid 5-alpha reductase family enzyme
MSYAALATPFVKLVECGASSAPLACGTQLVASETVVFAGLVALGLGLLCYVLSVFTGNDSWVDRSWSIVPPFYMWLYIWHRGDVVLIDRGAEWPQFTVLTGYALCATVWGIRLTYNFYRRGGYQKGGEDYRWEHVRAWPVFKNRVLWGIFSLTFISVFQQWLLWAITIPVLARKANEAPNPADFAIMGAMLFFIAVETIADQQQWNFQNQKRNLMPRRKHLEQDYKLGFLTHGLFSRSRHPNVWAEQQIWVTVYGASILAWGPFNWSGLGALSLVMLTVRSCSLTEQLSTAKHPNYRAYRAAVPMLVPTIFNPRAAFQKALDARTNATKNK